MANDTISAKLILRGVSETKKGVNQIADNLVKALGLLDKLEQNNAFVKGTDSIKKYRDELAKLNQELRAVEKAQRKATPSSGTPSSTPQSSPSNTPNNRTLRTAQEILSELDKQVIGTQTAIRRLNREVKEGVGRTDEEYKELITTLADLKNQSKQVTDEVRKQQREFAAVETSEGSYRRINEELVQLRKQYKDLSREDRDGDIGKGLIKNIQVLDRELKEIDASLGLFQRNVGNYKSAFNALSSALAFAGVELSLQGVKQGLEGIIQLNSDASTAFAGVGKTVQGINQNELAELEDIIKNRINLGETSTSLVDQLGIAEVGGRLGVAKEDIAGFVDAIDIAVIALKDDLGGGAESIATDLQKISGIFTRDREDVDGTADGILRVGSAINELAANGPASAAFLVDFSKRLSGVAPSAKVSVEEVLAFGAALEEAGQTQEVAASAFSQILTVIGSDVDQFASIAGLTVEELRDKLAVSGTDALLAVLEGSGKVDGGLEDLSATLEKFGVRGQRTAGVLAALANNTELVREKIGLANTAFEENTSLTAEAERVNAALSNRLANLKNVFQNAFTDLEVQEALSKIIDRLINFLRILQESGFTITGFARTIKENIPTILLLGVAIVALNSKLLILGIQSKLAAARMAILNAVAAVNPFGAVVAVIALLLIGLIQLSRNIDAAKESFANIRQRIDELVNSTGAFAPVIEILIRPLKRLLSIVSLVLDAIQNFPATLAGVKASFSEFFNSVTSSIAKFYEAGFDVDKLKAAASDLANAGEDAGKAYAEARNKYIQDNPPEAAVESSIQEAVSSVTNDNSDPESDPDNLDKNTLEAQRKKAEKDRKAREKEREERLRAVEKLEELVGSQLAESYANLTTQELELIEKQTSAAIIAAELKAREQQQATELAYQHDLALLEGQLLSRSITEEEFAKRSSELEYQRQADILASEREYLQTKLGLVEEIGTNTQLLEGEISEKELAATRSANAQKLEALREQLDAENKLREESRQEEEKQRKRAEEIELKNEKKKQEAKREIERSGLELLGSLIDRQTTLRVQQAESEIQNEEERAAAIEEIRRQQANKQKALAVFEIGINLIREISALSVAAAPDLTQITRTILTVAAVARAAAATVGVLSSEFSRGGVIGDLEGTGSGQSIPSQGPIIGPAHTGGGVLAIGPDGQLVELEGEEFKLMNGPETYIINKRNARAFRPTLNKLAAISPNRYSPQKRVLASMINAYNGKGQAFGQGGVLSAPSLPVSPAMRASISQEVHRSDVSGVMDASMQEAMVEMVKALDRRIDRLQVVTNPRKLVNQGLQSTKKRISNGL